MPHPFLHALDHPVPRRLSQATRDLARGYLETDAIRATLGRAVLDVPPRGERALHEHYADNVRQIAEQAPLRIRSDERIIGAATFLEAPGHACPGGLYGGTSHTTLNFGKALQLGLAGIEAEIHAVQNARQLDADETGYLKGSLGCIAAMRIWRDRYIQALPGSGPHAEAVLNILQQVPEHPARHFVEAVQSLWFFFEFQRLCGNWSGLGRVDALLGPYLEADLAAGVVTQDEAREYLAHFWIKGTEWKGVMQGSGDAQHYQNVILGGIDASGRDISNTVTELVLDVVEELHISDYPIAVRVNDQTTESMWRRIAAIQRQGGGIVSIYNERIVLEALQRFGYPADEAAGFTNDGCWEVIIPGKTAFTYWPFDALQILQRTLGLTPGQPRGNPATFEALYADFKLGLGEVIEQQNRLISGYFRDEFRESRCRNAKATPQPTTLLSLLMDDCIPRARSYNNRGAKYAVAAVHAGGLPDVVNSLLAIQRFVYGERRLTLDELRACLKNDWQGAEPLRQEIAASGIGYGNDDDAADAMMQRVFDDYCVIVGESREVDGVLRPAGISTFGRELAYAPARSATAFGYRKGVILAPNLAPTPGTDRNGPTAVVKSFCKNDFRKLPNGCPLDLKFHPGSVAGEQGLEALAALLKTFVACGGYYLQVDVADAAMLRDAQQHPERYPNLSVRISGWSARFTTLAPDWQEMIIRRTEQRF